MAICIYCGKKAGFFSEYHEACLVEAENNRNIGAQKIKEQILAAPDRNEPCSKVKDEVSQLASQYKLSPEVVVQAVVTGVDELSREEPLTPTKFDYLLHLCEELLGKIENIQPSYYPLIFNASLSNSLWLIMHGQKVNVPTACDVVLQADERRLAEFGTVLYRKSVLVASHTGGYNGVSVRIASGLYYRFGGFAGQTLPHEVQNIDNGFLTLTNKAMFFGGQQATFRIPYSSILRFKAYPDGLGFFRGIGGGREELFTIVDVWQTHGVGYDGTLVPPSAHYNVEQAVTLPVGWFLYNLVVFLTTPNEAS